MRLPLFGVAVTRWSHTRPTKCKSPNRSNKRRRMVMIHRAHATLSGPWRYYVRSADGPRQLPLPPPPGLPPKRCTEKKERKGTDRQLVSRPRKGNTKQKKKPSLPLPTPPRPPCPTRLPVPRPRGPRNQASGSCPVAVCRTPPYFDVDVRPALHP